MTRRLLITCCLFMLTLNFLLPASANAINLANSSIPRSFTALADVPTVDPNYIYDQLFYMVTSFQHREAGYDNNLPVSVNGHDEFAAYWSQEMMNDLQGFGPQVRRDPFPVQGWRGRPAIVPAFNVEVTVPGVTHPEQVVVIGCHYDGEAVSTQSANDDGSGCAIELGVAKAMAQYWRIHHVYPARTLRFVIFDAEEQGLFGSFHYLNNTINGDVQNIVAMFNEEQNGIAYPLRFLGEMANPLLPFYIYMSPLTNNDIYSKQSKLPQQQRTNIAHFRMLLQQALPAVFAQFQALGFQTLIYHGNTGLDFPQPIFTPDQLSYIQQADDNGVGSDQIPFTLAGVPCATFVGNSTYYDHNPPPPPWSYPYDQQQDTIQLMNIFANGNSQKALALELSLALPGMFTTWMLNQPSMLGQANADNNPTAAISDIGQMQPGQNIAFDARASFDPNTSSSALTYAWDFGDGTTGSGINVNHTYTTIGNYTLTLTVSSTAGGKRTLSKLISVLKQTTSYQNPFANFQSTGYPQPNPLVILPTSNNTGTIQTTPTPTTPLSTSSGITGLTLILIIGIGLLLALLVVGILLAVSSRRR